MPSNTRIYSPQTKYLQIRIPRDTWTRCWDSTCWNTDQSNATGTVTVKFSCQCYLTALQIDESVTTHPGVNVSGSRDMHHGSRKVAQGPVRENHIIWSQIKVTERTCPQSKHSEIKDKTVCQEMIDQPGVFLSKFSRLCSPTPRHFL